nr:uncharacterized protein LOC113823927 [Penaeus vannamei]
MFQVISTCHVLQIVLDFVATSFPPPRGVRRPCGRARPPRQVPQLEHDPAAEGHVAVAHLREVREGAALPPALAQHLAPAGPAELLLQRRRFPRPPHAAHRPPPLPRPQRPPLRLRLLQAGGARERVQPKMNGGSRGGTRESSASRPAARKARVTSHINAANKSIKQRKGKDITREISGFYLEFASYFLSSIGIDAACEASPVLGPMVLLSSSYCRSGSFRLSDRLAL